MILPAASAARRLVRPSLLAPDASRRRRVTLLVLAMALMGLADLAFTLTYMSSVGMAEANPLARAMIEIGGLPQLVRFKLFTIALSGGLLYLLRGHKAAERCAWACCAALVLLSLHWFNYTDKLTTLGAAIDPHLAALDERWVAIPSP